MRNETVTYYAELNGKLWESEEFPVTTVNVGEDEVVVGVFNDGEDYSEVYTFGAADRRTIRSVPTHTGGNKWQR